MVIGHLVGAGLIGIGVWNYMTDTPAKRFKKNLALLLGEEYTISKVSPEKYGFRAKVILPKDQSYTKLDKIVELLEQNTYSTIQHRQLTGRIVELKFGRKPLTDVTYNHDLPIESLSIPLATPFGLKLLNFDDETSCHLLVGGATRMGKTVFLRLIATHLMRATKGKIKIVFADNKITDLYMFRNLPQVKIAESQIECLTALEEIVKEINERKRRLKENYDCVDLKQYRKKHPHDPVEPIFIIIDEYGRYADNDDIQEMITFIAETAGYLDVHLIIASQRPDAKDVLKPRIKANIVTRMAFSTSDETNSKIILDSPSAAYLGKIQGRAILLDGTSHTVQVPYLSPDTAVKLLEPYYKKVGSADDRPRQANHQLIEEIPYHEPRSDCPVDLSRSREPYRNREPYLKEVIAGLAHHPDSAS